MAFRWEVGDPLTAENLNRSGNIGDILLPTDSEAEIQQRLTQVAMEGGGVVILRNGIYELTQDLVVPTRVTLEAEAYGNVVLDFQGQAAGVVVEGTDTYDTGTISVTNGSPTVTGTATSWSSNLTSGQQIFIYNSIYEIATVNSDTSLTLLTPFIGRDQTNIDYIAGEPSDSVRLGSLIIMNSTTAGLKMHFAVDYEIGWLRVYQSAIGYDFRYVANFTINNCHGVFCNLNMKFVDCAQGEFRSIVAPFSQQAQGFFFERVHSSTITGMVAWGCADVGAIFRSCEDTGWSDFICESNPVGISIENSNSIFLSKMGTIRNATNGISVIASHDVNITHSKAQQNGNYGISIDALSTDIKVTSTSFEYNVSGHIDDQGTGTVLSGNTPNELNIGSEVRTVTFDTAGSHTYTKPNHLKYIDVHLWAGGGGGGGRSSGTALGCGGGGGAYNTRRIYAGEISSTETVTIGAGGAGSLTSRGAAGGDTSFGSLAITYGGGGGHNAFNAPAGGGGGGQLSAGTLLTTGNSYGYTGGAPQGGVSVRPDAHPINVTESYGGGGAGGGNSSTLYDDGGNSYFGGGGGGSMRSGSKGGDSYWGGGGGAGGNTTKGTSVKGGDGGASGLSGEAPSGGGGGCDGSGNVGDGARGEMIIYEYF